MLKSHVTVKVIYSITSSLHCDIDKKEISKILEELAHKMRKSDKWMPSSSLDRRAMMTLRIDR